MSIMMNIKHKTDDELPVYNIGVNIIELNNKLIMKVAIISRFTFLKVSVNM